MGAATILNHQTSVHVLSLHATGDSVPEWLHVLPLGTFSGIDGRGPYVVKDADALVSLFQSEGKKLAVDENHSTDLAAKQGFSAPARGWIVELQKRSDGIWGRVEWTPEGKALMEGKSYGYLSPVFKHPPKPPFEVSKLLRVALTNDPNLTLTALHAAQKGSAVDEEELLAALRSELELGTDADGAAILDGVKKLKVSRNSADPAQFVPIGTFQATVAELNKLRSGISLQAAEKIVDQALNEARLMPYMRDWAVSLCQTNAAAFDDFLNGAGKPVANFAFSLSQPAADWKALHQRDRGDKTELTEVNRVLGHSAEDIQKYGAKADK
ncbi:hypothetical protein O9X99_16645 [Agrobacterium salinitolerans]|uniref:phage protease n=1 Tax=Agrobacterium salinitolerans TaxID=1183413 RepID=UPI0022B821BD|nr:phage protease [Agrobacterium salinitolerans]MCZ7893301.1 hypothetical protein [Agrobacterium salinitolerans]